MAAAETAAAVAMVASAVFGMFSGGEQEQPIQYPQLNFQPQQAPQIEPFQGMGLPQTPEYQTPPAIGQFQFPQRRLGQ